MSNNVDINSLLSMLAKMDKKDLEKGMEQASKYLNSKDKKNVIDTLNKEDK